ncbi:hypothetical protein NQ318_022318 [Aromia moschata]|uniref:Uncharacterized protein n=1 Tax=Aromia moschata TaxID=1265417 RepID=A0AAV8Z742_9CUCU|nr:hypothetical protein NQ318_022318 [Aromia moschata]
MGGNRSAWAQEGCPKFILVKYGAVSGVVPIPKRSWGIWSSGISLPILLGRMSPPSPGSIAALARLIGFRIQPSSPVRSSECCGSRLASRSSSSRSVTDHLTIPKEHVSTGTAHELIPLIRLPPDKSVVLFRAVSGRLKAILQGPSTYRCLMDFPNESRYALFEMVIRKLLDPQAVGVMLINPDYVLLLETHRVDDFRAIST